MLSSVAFQKEQRVCGFLRFFITPVNKPQPQFSYTLNSHHRNCQMWDLSEKINQTLQVCVTVLLRSFPSDAPQKFISNPTNSRCCNFRPSFNPLRTSSSNLIIEPLSLIVMNRNKRVLPAGGIHPRIKTTPRINDGVRCAVLG